MTIFYPQNSTKPDAGRSAAIEEKKDMKKSNPTLYWVHCPYLPGFLRKLQQTLVNVVRLKKVVCEP